MFLHATLSLSLSFSNTSHRERERERKREEKEIFFKGMTGALAPFSYLVININSMVHIDAK
jgi:hypothetical protein